MDRNYHPFLALKRFVNTVFSDRPLYFNLSDGHVAFVDNIFKSSTDLTGLQIVSKDCLMKLMDD